MTDPRSEGLLRSAYHITFLLVGIGLVVLLRTGRWDWIGSYLVGVVVSTGGLLLLQWLVPRILQEHGLKETSIIVGVILGKYSLIAFLFYLLARFGWLNLPAFVAGFFVLHAVLAIRFWSRGVA